MRKLIALTVLALATACTNQATVNQSVTTPFPQAKVGLQVHATLAPTRTVVLANRLLSAAPETANDCTSALTQLEKHGAKVARSGRLDMQLTASRNIQVTVDQIALRVVSEPMPPMTAVAACSYSDRRELGLDDADQAFVPGETVIAGNTQDIPWIRADSVSADYFINFAERYGNEPLLSATELILGPRNSVTLPLYLVNDNPQRRQGFLINLYLTVNGNSYLVPINNSDGQPFWIHGPLSQQDPASGGKTRTLEYLVDTRSWVVDRPLG